MNPKAAPEQASDQYLLAEAHRLAQLCKALAHPARVRIVQALWRKQGCIGCDLMDDLGLAQSTTSEHLRILKQAGVIHGEIEHPRVCYHLNPDTLKVLQHWLQDLRGPAPHVEADVSR